MKGVILPAHIAVNKYELVMVGLPALTAIEISGLDEELDNIELPDRTRVSGGNTKPVECTIKIPMHHVVEFAAMESWYREGQDPVSPLYKKDGSLLYKSISTIGPTVSFSLFGVFLTQRKTPDLEMKNEGDMAIVEYKMSIDFILPA